MTLLALFLMVLACMATLLDWRKGLLVCVVIGIAQDPLRKMAPGQPVFYVVLVGVVFALAWVRAGMKGVPLGPSAILGWKQYLKVPFTLFVVLVLVQAMYSFARYGSLYMASIGLLVWLTPIPAVVLAYQYATRRGVWGVRRWMTIYIGVALLSLSGVYFEYAGFQWRSLGEIGEGQIIYDLGGILKAHSGFFRASEIAAWHTAAISCFLFMLTIGKRLTFSRVLFAAALVCVLISLGILTGRRKMLVEITIFLTTYAFLVAWLQRSAARLAIGAAVVGVAAYVAIIAFVAPDLVGTPAPRPDFDVENARRLEDYALRGQSVFAELPRRISAVGVQPLLWAVDRFGWTGAGLGTGSQGTNAIAEAHNINRWAAEGGLGKVAMELGVPGLLLAAWLVVALARHLRQHLLVLERQSAMHARMAYGFVAFLVANAATFMIATQAYSDLFVLLILGWCLGFLLAMPALAASGDRGRPVRRRSRVLSVPEPNFTATLPAALHGVARR